MPTSVPGTPFDDGSEADLHDQVVPAMPESAEDEPLPGDFADTVEGSEADLLDQTEEVDLDDDELEPG